MGIMAQLSRQKSKIFIIAARASLMLLYWVQIGLFILETPKLTFYHDVISPAALATHALPDFVLFYKVYIRMTCKLTSLIRIKNDRLGYLGGFF